MTRCAEEGWARDMLKKQIETFAAILKNNDLRAYSGEAFWNLIQAVISQDLSDGLASIKNVKDLVFHMPTVLFWSKMQRFLFGTYNDFEEQVKMASRFNDDTKKYSEFVKKQIYLVNEIDDDEKIDYYAALTRCLLVMELEIPLYFKLAKLLVICTPYELAIIKNNAIDFRHNNSAVISSLYQYGLVEQDIDEKTYKTSYVLSSFGKALKECSLNYTDDNMRCYRLSYEALEPLGIAEAMSINNIDKLF